MVGFIFHRLAGIQTCASVSAFVSGGDDGAVSYQDVLRIGRGYVCKGLRMCLACHSGVVNVVDSNVMMTTFF